MKVKKINTDKMVKIISKIGQQRELNTIRDTFALLLPLVIAGAIGIIGITFFFGGWGSQSVSILGWIAKASGGIKDTGNASWEFIGTWKEVSLNGVHVFKVLYTATFGWISIYVVFIIGYTYSQKLNSKTPMLGGMISLASFLICGGHNSFFFGANGMLGGILIGFLSTYIFTKLQTFKKLTIRMPEGVPPAVGRSFSALFAILITTLIFALWNYIFWVGGNYGVVNLLDKENKMVLSSNSMSFLGMFFKGFTSPFISFVGSKNAGFGILLIYTFAYGFFWWCGIHGGSVLSGIFYPIWFGLIIQNSEAVEFYGSYEAAKQAGKLAIANWAFIEQFILLTGWGTTGMLILGSAIFSRNPIWKKINKIAIPAGIFNINEPVTYGYPIMFNPILAIPSLLACPLAGTIAYLSTSLGLVRTTYIYVPWALPAPIGPLLSTGMDWRSIIVVLIIFVAIFFLYLPFIFIDNRLLKKNKTEMVDSFKDKIFKKYLKAKN